MKIIASKGSILGGIQHLGDVWTLDQLWKELGFDDLARVFRKARYTTPVEHALRVMVFNRLCDPESKLGVLRWLETVSIPEVDTPSLTHQQLLRSMDALMWTTRMRWTMWWPVYCGP
jgi:hypothetical protein